MKRALFLGLLLAVQPPALAQSGPNENWTEVNLAVVDTHVIPRYADFADAAGVLGNRGRGLCDNLDRPAFDALREAYHGAMDAWQGIQHVQFGPITFFNWNYRLQFWPDENGTGARQLEALLAREDPAALNEENFPRQSVGAQGFPALERLLYEEDSLARLQNNDYRCRVVETIAQNIAEIGTEVHQRWMNEFRDTVATAAEERGFFESERDATIDLLKALVEPFPRIRDQKIGAPLGDSFERVRARRAESWRSGRSLRNIRINIRTLEAMFNQPGDGGVVFHSVFHQEDVTPVNEHFRTVRETLAALPDSMVQALATEAGYRSVSDLHTQVDRLYEALEQALKNTDLYLGFNSLDGD